MTKLKTKLKIKKLKVIYKPGSPQHPLPAGPQSKKARMGIVKALPAVLGI